MFHHIPAGWADLSGVPSAHRVRLLLAALFGIALIGLTTFSLANRSAIGTLDLIGPGADGPSVAAVRADFPNRILPSGLGHDGQQYYAVARQPMHLDRVAADLDRPRYRLQRIAFPLLVWAVHPSGGGEGLVLATFAVGVVAVFAGIYATGALSVRLGGSPWLAFVFAAAPATLIALKLSVADSLALAAAIAAVVALLAKRPLLAIAPAVLAVLAKESLLLILIGFALGRRDKASIRTAIVAGAATASWWIALRFLVEDHGRGVIEFTYPFGGLIESMRWWADGKYPIALMTVPLTLIFAVVTLSRVGLRHPLGWVIAIQLLFIPFLGPDVIGLDANGTRMTAPVLVFAAVARATLGAGSTGSAGDADDEVSEPAEALASDP